MIDFLGLLPQETIEGLLKSKFVLYHCIDAAIENMMSPLLW